MKHCFFLILSGLMLCLNTQGQDRYTVKGAFLDSLTGKAISFGAVSLYQNKKQVKAMLTDSMGRFKFQGLPDGNYHIQFSGLGYQALQTAHRLLNGGDSLLDFGTIRLMPKQLMLKTVTIRGQRPVIEQRVDGITFNVENLPAIAGSDAADVLRRVPMIAVDPNSGLSVRGSSQVKVLIDGKPSERYASTVADALKTIRGENIVKVEVITNPSAKYDAEGADAVVNIITRKIKVNITNGSIGGIIGNRTWNLMGDVHSKHNGWLFNADAFYQRYWNSNGALLQREAAGLQLSQQNETRQAGYYIFGGAGIVYSLDSLNTFSIGYRSRPSADVTNGDLASESMLNGLPEVPFQRHTRSPNSNWGHIFNVGYTGTSKDGRREWSLMGSYSPASAHSDYELEQVQNGLINYREKFSGQTSNHDFIIQADYSQSLGNKLKWETGVKATGKRLQSESRFDIDHSGSGSLVTDVTRSNDFTYQTHSYAAYHNLSLKLQKWGVSAGLRYEQTELDGVFKQTTLGIPAYHNLVPQLLINRIINDKTSLKLSYAMKIARPPFSYLNPTVNSSDSLNIRAGNPYLKPEITNRYQLSYTVSGAVLFKDVALFFNDNRNTIAGISTPLPGGVFKNTWQNTGKNQRLGLAATLNWKPSTAFNIGATFTGQYVWLKSAELGIDNAGFMHQLVVNSSYKLPGGYSVSFYGFFDARNLSLQGYREGWKYYSMTISKLSKNERLNLSLRMDAFLTPYSYIDEEVSTGDFHQLQTSRYQNQNLRLTFSYKLGKAVIKSPRVKQTDTID